MRHSRRRKVRQRGRLDVRHTLRANAGYDGVTFEVMRKAVIYGSVLASFCVEAFSLERLRKLTQDEIADRYQMFKMMSQFEVLS